MTSGDRKVLKPRGAGRLVLILRDINLPRADKYATVQLVAWLQQVLGHGGFYDAALDFVALQNVQIVGEVAPASTPGRRELSPRFTALVRVLSVHPLSDADVRAIAAPRLARALRPRQLPGGELAKLLPALLALHTQFSDTFSSGDSPQYSLSSSAVLDFIDGLAQYNWQEDSTATAAAVFDAAQRALRGRLACPEHRRQFDDMLAATLLPGLAVASPPTGVLFSTVGAAAQDRLAGAAVAEKLTPWAPQDFHSWVRRRPLPPDKLGSSVGRSRCQVGSHSQ